MLQDTLKVHRLILALHHHGVESIATVMKLDNLIITVGKRKHSLL